MSKTRKEARHEAEGRDRSVVSLLLLFGCPGGEETATQRQEERMRTTSGGAQIQVQATKTSPNAAVSQSWTAVAGRSHSSRNSDVC